MELLKRLKEKSWKHFLFALLAQIIITISANDWLNSKLLLFGQVLIALFVWFLLNHLFEIIQKNRLNGTDTLKEILFDNIGAALGGVCGVLIGILLL